MQAILDLLNGKKTYIIAVAYGIDAVGAQLGWWAADSVRTAIEQVFTIVAVRAGITKSGPNA